MCFESKSVESWRFLGLSTQQIADRPSIRSSESAVARGVREAAREAPRRGPPRSMRAMPICSSCGHDNPDGARFCMSCGAALEVAAERRDERKVVSVVFADLVGFTSRAEQLDVEEVRGTLEAYHG